MMVDPQDYEANDGLSLESVREGKLYAGKFQIDWYRYATFSSIKEITYGNNNVFIFRIFVYFCEFKDVTIISRSSLQPLKSQFLKLPYQAINAKLVSKRKFFFPFKSFSLNACIIFSQGIKF